MNQILFAIRYLWFVLEREKCDLHAYLKYILWVIMLLSHIIVNDNTFLINKRFKSQLSIKSIMGQNMKLKSKKVKT